MYGKRDLFIFFRIKIIIFDSHRKIFCTAGVFKCGLRSTRGDLVWVAKTDTEIHLTQNGTVFVMIRNHKIFKNLKKACPKKGFQFVFYKKSSLQEYFHTKNHLHLILPKLWFQNCERYKKLLQIKIVPYNFFHFFENYYCTGSKHNYINTFAVITTRLTS